MRLLIAFFLSALVWGQAQAPDQADTMEFYSATYEASLSGSADALTIQLPANTAKRIYPQSISLWCSVDCTITQEINGTAATQTLVTAVPLNGSGTPSAKVYRGSNVGTGSALPKHSLSASGLYTITTPFVAFIANKSTVQNYTVRVNAITGTWRATFLWGERR